MADHLTPDQSSRYLKRTLSPSELIITDGHLSTCTECRQQVMASFEVDAAYSSLRRDLQAQARLQPTHLTYEELEKHVDQQMYVADREIVDSHVESCAMCREELLDLQKFRESLEKTKVAQAITQTPYRRVTFWLNLHESWRRPAYWGGTAAALAAVIVIAVLLPFSRSFKSHSALTTQSSPVIRGMPKASSSSKPQLDTPKELANLIGKTETLLSSAGSDKSFELIGPIGTFVEDVRPTFHWRELPGANSYKVSIFDSALNEIVTSATLYRSDWKSTVPLKRGVVYLWQVTALKNGQQIVSPVPPAPEAKFEVLEQNAADRLAQAEHDALESQFELGRAYAEAGVLDKAEAEFRLVSASDPKYQWAQEFIQELRALRHSDGSKP